MTRSRIAGFALVFSITLLTGCAAQPPRLTIPEPLLHPKAGADAPLEGQDPGAYGSSALLGPGRAAEEDATREMQRSETPTRALSDTATSGINTTLELPPMGATPVSVNVENVPIPVFVNEVFGDMLGLNVNIDPAVAKLQELVTLRTAEAQRPRELYLLGKQVLADYGVQVNMEGKLLQVRMGARGTTGDPPLVISGRALPEVPISHRPVFQLIELEIVRTGDATRWLNTLFGTEIKAQEDPQRNAVLISGKPAQVRYAVDAIKVFDRPLMRGRISTRLEPAFMSAEQLADRLVEVLAVQGYGASRALTTPSSVILLPVPAVNSLLVFAVSPEVLEYTVSWARELDRPNETAGSQSIFYYQVKNTKAMDISRILNPASQMMRSNAGVAAAGGASDGSTAPQQAAATASGLGGLLVDEARNALIYQGDPAQWERMLTLIRQMDRAPRQVMMEVTIAEVTLDGKDEFGVSWFAKSGFSRFDGSIFSGSGSGGAGGGSGGNGLTYLLDVAGQNRFALRAFASDSRVSILSTPRIMVKSGNEASIDIGTEVPIISMQTTSNQQTEGTTNLLQSIQYRKTGIILSVTPTVYSDDRIDLDISQEVSEALPVSEDSSISSPSIFNRSLNTSLSLRDGGSVVMAGLMSNRVTNSDGGIPLLKDVPVLGSLFKNQSKQSNKTELVLMIVPYIIESDERASIVSQAIIDRLELLELSDAYPTGTINTPATIPQTLPANL